MKRGEYAIVQRRHKIKKRAIAFNRWEREVNEALYQEMYGTIPGVTDWGKIIRTHGAKARKER